MHKTLLHTLITTLILSTLTFSSLATSAGFSNLVKKDQFCAEEQKPKDKKKEGESSDEEPECD
ncbi:MAG: hypothetical protein OEX12_09850 [Gammaproteobacteria bacterium]|nr:hypothetical protein [Gammaproteobacteria bacterium]